ncbi:MAG: hypothetical protein GY775_06250 [Candidatus Scalindua sp.]|nr:hypothetical protein [Candidatus Scalindua sp.]
MANETILLVSEQRMKQWTSLDSNIRIDVLTPSILNAQQSFIQDTLGTPFFNRLKEGVLNNDLTTDEAAFLKDYVGPALMQYALYLLLPHLKYKFVEKGIVSGASEESTQTSLDELKYLRESALDQAQFYDERMKEFLKDYPALFPIYRTWNSKGMSPNKRNTYYSGLQTDIPRRYERLWIYEDCGTDCDPDCSTCQ